MPGLVSNSEENVLIGDYEQVFDTFSRPIVIYKQPIKTALVTGPQNPGLFGMGDGQVATQYTYIPVSGVYNGIVRYVNTKRNIAALEVVEETNTVTAIGEVMVKFDLDGYNFIENSGQTDKFYFDSRDWYFASKARAMPFLGAAYFQYQLKPKP